ncbi:MAG: helix-turn-helix domain-containing protein [Phycisphaerae bacterium]|nr:MAG: DNA-binding protein [Planctomycetota bacterium]MBE7457389.1 helix-turn-helix domain-containing protein [Planctomycetia bacterium]MCL4719348.1 helix-turn-helix domain-containing protein [Phycisphaerae bacterium]
MPRKLKAGASKPRGPFALLGGVLTIPELAEYLKISQSTLYKLALEGKVPGQKVGKHWRFHRDAVDAWLKNEGSSRAK